MLEGTLGVALVFLTVATLVWGGITAIGAIVDAYDKRRAQVAEALCARLSAESRLSSAERELRGLKEHLNLNYFSGSHDPYAAVARQSDIIALSERLDKLGAKLGVRWVAPSTIELKGEWSSD